MALSKIDADGVSGLQATLTAATTVPSEGGAATTNLVQGLAKAWSNINGTGTIASYDSLNITSILDSNTGHYQINITNAMNDTNYGITTGGSNSLTNFVGRVASPVNTKTSSAYGIETINNGGSAHEDYVHIMSVTNGDLA